MKRRADECSLAAFVGVLALAHRRLTARRDGFMPAEIAEFVLNVGNDLEGKVLLRVTRVTATLRPVHQTVTSGNDGSGVALVGGAGATSVFQGSTLHSQCGRDTFGDIQVQIVEQGAS